MLQLIPDSLPHLPLPSLQLSPACRREGNQRRPEESPLGGDENFDAHPTQLAIPSISSNTSHSTRVRQMRPMALCRKSTSASSPTPNSGR